MSLTQEERNTLLKLARQTLGQAVQGRGLSELDLESLPERLQEPGASFITLTIQNRLRGCVGTLDAALSLAEDVRNNVIAAAFSDPRFSPLQPQEFDTVAIEISCLTPLQPLPYQSPQDLLAQLRPGVDGVLIRDGLRRATFLPKVWGRFPDGELLLDLLCQKMGAEADFWRNNPLEVFTYQAETFHE